MTDLDSLKLPDPDELSDDDPEVVAGMKRYRALRAAEGEIRELPARE